MPASICPICKYANMDSTEECINCGASFRGARVPERRVISETARTGLVDTTSAGPTPLQGEVVSSTLKRQPAQPARQERVPAVRSEAQSHSVREGENQRGVVPYRESALVPAQADNSPYAGSMDMQPYYPQPLQPLPFQTRVVEEELVDDPEPWKTNRLPWYLPHRRPHLTGRIISMHNEMEFPDYPNVLRALVDLMAEFLWIAANQPSHKEGERVQVTILRIRTSEGHLQDTRLMGYMRGADLTLGDQVSFWGWKRRGTLLIRTGYNYTSKATITTNMLSMLLPGLILLALVFAIFLFSVYRADFGPLIDALKRLFSR